jgi:hypothetical protein
LAVFPSQIVKDFGDATGRGEERVGVLIIYSSEL